MYNSVIICGLVGLWNFFSDSYGRSLLKKTVDKIKNLLSFFFEYSQIKKMFVSKDSLILKSMFYIWVSKVILFADSMLHKINKFFMGKSSNSLVYRNMDNLFKDNKHIIKTIAIFVVSFSSGIILNNFLVFHYDLHKAYIFSIILIFMGMFTIIVSNNYREILDGSSIWRFILGLFLIDEGGENWW